MREDSLRHTVIHNFNQSAGTYDEVAYVQKACAAQLVQLIINNLFGFCPKTILDIGTGTGFVTGSLLPYFPHSTYFLNDIAPAMIDKTRSKFSTYPHIHFHVGNAETSAFEYTNLTISNLAFQWFSDLPGTIARFFKNCDVLAFSTLSQNTFTEWTDIFKHSGLQPPTFSYPPREKLQNYCLSLQPRHWLFAHETHSLSFDSAEAFAKYLKRLGAHTPSHSLRNQYDLRRVIKKHNQPIATSYEVFFAILQR